jgi:copper chaperone
MRTVTLKVEGMSCSHCQQAVTKALKGVPGVAEARVDLGRHEATVTYDPARGTLEQMAAAVGDAGYRLVLSAAGGFA